MHQVATEGSKQRHSNVEEDEDEIGEKENGKI
jgi:hypothetical protein